jgi:holin-like protein
MILGLTWLIAFQLLGEVTVRLLDVPIPGAVVGMGYLFAWLRLRRVGDEAPVVRAGSGLLRHLQLFFVPAGVGITAHLADLADSWLPILVAMLVSWFLALAVVGWGAVALERLFGKPRDDLEPDGRTP